MIANAAFLAALSVFLFAGWLAGELRFLAPYKTVLFHEHAALIGGAALILFLNLTATSTAWPAGCSCATPAASCCTSTVSLRPTMPCSMTCGRT